MSDRKLIGLAAMLVMLDMSVMLDARLRTPRPGGRP